jgi:osmotically-inducible protein OsmY
VRPATANRSRRSPAFGAGAADAKAFGLRPEYQVLESIGDRPTIEAGDHFRGVSMHRLQTAIFPLAFVLALPMTLGGCVGALVVGGLAAAGGAGYEAAQERGVNGTIDDFAIKANIQQAWNQTDPRFDVTLTLTVYQGQVLLTGDAADPAMKRRAAEIAGRVPGVRRVFDNIEVANTSDAWDAAQDAWISTQVRSDLLLEDGVRSENYEIETANRSVYLMGSARSQTELDKATYLARYVPGVRRVVSYVEIRSGVPVASEQGPQSYPGSGPASADGYPPPTSPPPGPSAPIQVQKL